jgi:hypothetical protein
MVLGACREVSWFRLLCGIKATPKNKTFTSMKYFYRRIILRRVHTVMALSEAIYPVRVDWGIAIFSQGEDAAPEQQGELEKPFLGFNYICCANVHFLTPIPVCHPEDTLQGKAYCPAKTPEDAVNVWKDYIKNRRNQYGFRLTTKDIKAIRDRIASTQSHGDHRSRNEF